jgi:hypothetical protein
MHRLTVVALLICCLTTGCLPGGTRRSWKVLIPQGYVGWIRVELKVKGAATLPVEDGYLIVRIPNMGLLQTSSVWEEGWGSDVFCYVNTSGREQALPDGNKDSFLWGDSSNGANRMIFIGTKNQFMSTPDKSPKPLLPLRSL